MFEIQKTIARDAQGDLNDTAKTKFALTALGYYDDTQMGLSPYADDQFFQSVQAFQKDNGLKKDGVIKPNGSTLSKIKEKLNENGQAIGAFKDFSKNYIDLKRANTVNADKYFHCKANYEASKKGFTGEQVAKNLSDGKEKIDKLRKKHLGITQFTNLDSFRDQGANIYGREAAKSDKFKSAKEACEIFRPDGLDEKY